MSQRLGCTYLRNGIVLALFFILSYVADFAFLAVAQLPDVHILDILHDTLENAEETVMAYKHGFNASLWSRNFDFAGRRVHMDPVYTPLDAVASTINQAVSKNPDFSLVLGPSSAVRTLAALPALQHNNLVAFGPFTELSAAHIWDPHLYFLQMGTKFSTYSLLGHAMINLRLRRIGFMYTTDILFGSIEYEYAVKLLHGTGRELCGVFRLDGRVSHNAEDVLFQKEWEAFAETRPQAVIIMGVWNSTTEPFIQQMMRDPRTTSAYLMAPSMLEGFVLDKWEEAQRNGAHSFSGQVITTATYPALTDTTSIMVNMYRKVIWDYLEKSGQTLYNPADGIPIGRNNGGAMLAGWVAGEVLFQAISQFNPLRGKKEFISSLFNQRSYFLWDVIIGTFGGDISENFVKAGAVARCNYGATKAYLKRFLNATSSESVHEGDGIKRIQDCQGHNLTLFDSAAIVTVNVTDMGLLGEYITNEILMGHRAGVYFSTSETIHDMAVNVIQSPHNDITSVMQKEQEYQWMNIVLGMVLDSTMDIPNLAFIDPMTSVAQVNKYRRNAIILSPTIEQQLFVFAQYVASLPDRTVYAVTRSRVGEDALDVLEKSLLTFGVELNSSYSMEGGGNLKDGLGTRGLTVIIGVNEAYIPVFVEHLEQNPNARVVVLFVPFSVYYKKFRAAFNGTKAADRLLLITNLPHWAEVNSASTLIRNYHAMIEDPSDWSPLSLQNFIVGRVLHDAVERLPVVDVSSVIQYFYSSIAVLLDDMSFGPFSDNSSVTCTSNSKRDSLACAKNFGATSITVWSMSRVFDPTLPTLFGPANPSMVYIDISTGLTGAQLIGVIVGSVVGASVLIAVLALLIYCFCMGNANAPKNLEDPVTLIFTDIQSSTALWATCPGVMPDAVATHHRLIRRLIAKYKCYEVKTIGDSFMIACKSASAAVQLVVDLQRTFLQHDWGTSAIDDAYREFEEQQAAEDADYEPPTARLDAAVYRKYWSGLRVRAGVHTGLSDIQHDEVTKRYDYYGSTSNTAARTESVAHGGQVLLTRAAYMALSTAERAGLDVTALGPVELRGVPQPVDMYQLNAVPGRAFAKLRLDRECDELDGDTSTLHGTETSVSQSDALNPAAEHVFILLQDVFSPPPVQQRLKILEPICKRWNVDIPKANSQRDALAVSRLAEQRLAIKISRVIERRREIHRGQSGSAGVFSPTTLSMSRESWSRASFFRENAFFTDMASRRVRDNEEQDKNCLMPFHLLQALLDFSPGNSIQLLEPSFIGFGAP